MPRINWKAIKNTLTDWRDWGLPGAIVIGLIMAARATGSLQGLELVALDIFLRQRPPEPPDDRIVLVGFDDIHQSNYPISEQDVVAIITQLEAYKPAFIGLHIQKNQIAESSKSSLFSQLGQIKNLIMTEVILPPADQILAPYNFPKKRTGFVDIFPDGDTSVRRISLGLTDPIDFNIYRFSFVIRLADSYLISRDPALKLDNGLRDRSAMRFGTTELPRLLYNSGGYTNAEVGNPEILLNFRSGANPFRLFTVEEITTGKVEPTVFRDRIVIVGITDPVIRPPSPTAATNEISSLQIQAHGVSQIISAVLDGRPLLHTWTEHWEYLWIIGWGILAIIWGHTGFSNRIKLVGIGIVQIGLIGSSYLLLVWGWWIPIVPVSLVWLINSLGYTAFHKYDWVLRSRLKEEVRLVEDRQKLIEQIFNVIHNGPLQTLSTVLRKLRDQSISTEKLLPILENLNTEIRQIGEHAKQEALSDERSLYLRDGIKLDLQSPLHELLYEVYIYTLDRPEFAHFKSLKVSYEFEPVDSAMLNIEQRESLCRFLEEALCNVGKHAENATHLTVLGTYHQGWYTLRVVDDGLGMRQAIEGEGTRYARRVASQLRGKFKRERLLPNGTLCQLSLPLVKFWQWS